MQFVARSRGSIAAALAIVAAMAAVPLVGQSRDSVDLQAVFKIKDEGLQRSKVMEMTSYLTDVYGPRLTGSPNIRKAGEWAVKEMQGWGLANTKLEPWGPFGRGWTNDHFSAHMTAPTTATLIGYPKAWTPGTNGSIKADAIFAPLDTERDLDNFRGKLKGKIVLTTAARSVEAHFEAQGRRYTDDELEARARQQVGQFGRGGADAAGRGRPTRASRPGARRSS